MPRESNHKDHKDHEDRKEESGDELHLELMRRSSLQKERGDLRSSAFPISFSRRQPLRLVNSLCDLRALLVQNPGTAGTEKGSRTESGSGVDLDRPPWIPDL